jgi:hypothetical protein
MPSRSLYDSNISTSRSLINPNNRTITTTVTTTSPYTFSDETILAIKAIQQSYTFNLANQHYSNIPTNYTQFLYLYGVLVNTISTLVDENLKILFQTTIEGLSGSMNAYGLSVDKTELNLKINILEKTISDMESAVNIHTAITAPCGQYKLTKAFTLAPLFSYYIMLYGLPDAGVGFDQAKLSILLSILERQSIDPYN